MNLTTLSISLRFWIHHQHFLKLANFGNGSLAACILASEPCWQEDFVLLSW